MSVAPEKGWRMTNRLTFKCPQCRAQEVHKVGVAGSLIRAPAGSL